MVSKIKNVVPQYIVYKDGDEAALAAMGAGTGVFQQPNGYQQSVASYGTKVRDSGCFTHTIYGSTPQISYREIINVCNNAYKTNGIIKNIIDLMTDFVVRGLQLVHPNKNIEDFHQQWFKKVELYDRAERFVSSLLRLGIAIPKRDTAKLNQKDLDNLQQGIAASGSADLEPDEVVKVGRGEIPYWYTFQNPMALDVIGGEELSTVSSITNFVVPISKTLANKVKSPKNDAERRLVSKTPKYIVEAIQRGDEFVELDPDKVSVYFYKKDDWEMFATPMTYSIINDVITYDKLKRADIAALDSAISRVRLWKLGSLEHQIAPGPEMIEYLASVLAGLSGGAGMDLVWNAAIDFKETSADAYKFLGAEKYGPTLLAIYTAMGIPTAAQGGSAGGGGGGNLDKYLSLKVLTERLSYCRRVLSSWIQQELKIVQRACGFRFPAQERYDQMIFTDEDAYKRLLIELNDRGLLSDETVQERFGEMPDIEAVRIKREANARKSGKVGPKAGPYYSPNLEADLKKIALQAKTATPSEVGLELEEGKPHEEDRLAINEPTAGGGLPNAKKSPKPNGRPKGAKDTNGRKPRKLTPSSANYLEARGWASKAQSAIADIINPAYLGSISKEGLRNLTEDEFATLELVKFGTLFGFQPHSEITTESVLAQVNTKVPDKVKKLLSKAIAKQTELTGLSPTVADIRLMQAEVYAMYSCKKKV